MPDASAPPVPDARRPCVSFVPKARYGMRAIKLSYASRFAANTGTPPHHGLLTLTHEEAIAERRRAGRGRIVQIDSDVQSVAARKTPTP